MRWEQKMGISIPTPRAASVTSVPGGTLTGTLSMVMLTKVTIL